MKKLTRSLRDQLKIPLGVLLPESKADKINIQDHLLDYNYLVTVGDRTTEKMINFGLIPDMQIIDGLEKREKRSSIKSAHINELSVDNPAAEITTLCIQVIKKAFTLQSPVRILVHGEEDLLVIPVCIYAPDDTIVLYGQPNEGLVIVKVTSKIRNKTKLLLNLMK